MKMTDEYKAEIRRNVRDMPEKNKIGFVRWMIRCWRAGFDVREDLLGEHHGKNV